LAMARVGGARSVGDSLDMLMEPSADMWTQVVDEEWGRVDDGARGLAAMARARRSSRLRGCERP
jgi:hypothetical protein